MDFELVNGGNLTVNDGSITVMNHYVRMLRAQFTGLLGRSCMHRTMKRREVHGKHTQIDMADATLLANIGSV